MRVSGINSTGCSRRSGSGKQEIRTDIQHQYTYTYENVIRMIHNKALIISDKNNGSYNSCELLIDLEAIEGKYLNKLQRRIIKLKYVYWYTNMEIADLLGCERKKIGRIIADIENTLSEVLTHDI
jgi:DNA-directed RNA polymerase specialized sigma subunit